MSAFSYLGRPSPIGPLMREHALIEIFVQKVKDELGKTNSQRLADHCLIYIIVDFFKTYADRTHHGKEEGILFKQLSTKQLSEQHRITMNELIEEHIHARKTVARLVEARNRLTEDKPEALKDIRAILEDLVKFYPLHIEKEDKHFFYPSMGYFNNQELDEMLKEFWEFDQRMIHEKYETLLKSPWNA